MSATADTSRTKTAITSALVTGASGFIGGHLVRRLAEASGRVACLVRATSAIEPLRAAGAELVIGDVTSRTDVAQAISSAQPDVVFHLAGLVRARRQSDFMRVNAGGVEAVAAACASCRERPTLVVVSSLAAAGPSADSARTERDPPTPVSAYGKSKLAGERAALKFAKALPITIVRPPIVFGPGDRGVLQMLRPIARWGIHPVPGRGEVRLSLVHVEDLVDGILAAAEHGERVGEDGGAGHGVYFVAAPEHPTYAELGEIMASALGRNKARIVRVPRTLLRLAGFAGDALAPLRKHKGWVNSDKVTEALAGSWMCDSRRAQAELGWQPRATLRVRMAETVEWYRSAGWL